MTAATARRDVVDVAGGSFTMGSAEYYPEEQPVHTRAVSDFAIDRAPVTNRQFQRFVDDTGYTTIAERPLEPDLFPGADPADLVPGGLVFTMTAGPVDLRDWRQWWRWQPAAHWRQPTGPGSDVADKADHPVVQIAFPDAMAYAEWAGGRLPTEAEWEYAAVAGTVPDPYAWGRELQPQGLLMANTWQGNFPYDNRGAYGWVGTSPVGTFPTNGYGLLDMIGNVWEWTSDYYTSSHHSSAQESPGPATRCACAPTENSRAAADSAETGASMPRRVLKGGSHLCASEYCLRYRPAARTPQAEDTATTHIGFRLAYNG